MPEKITDEELKLLIDLNWDYNTVYERAIYLAAVELQKCRDNVGTWINQRREVAYGRITDHICSVCKERCWQPYDYCPNCGAKMVLKELEG